MTSDPPHVAPGRLAHMPGHGVHFGCGARYVANYGGALVTLMHPRPGEHLLDIGCGDGTLSRALLDAGARVTGIDIDPAMVALATANGVAAQTGDAAQMQFRGAFDGVFSNAALHFIRDIQGMAARVAVALKPAGRFVAEFGAHGNIAAITTALIAVLERYGVNGGALLPWYFPTPEEYCGVLEAAGFTIESIQTFHRPTPMPGGVRGWTELLGRWFLDALREADRDAACEDLVRLLSYSLQAADGAWTADYVHMRFKAVLPKRGA